MGQLQVIQNKIYEIRGQRVMLDFDLAELYGTETRVLKQAVKRNIPFAFTEQGVAMLSSVLNNETAIEININIMRAFVTVRQYLTSANGTIKEIEELKQRMKALEQGSEDTIAAINDLSEDTRRELDDIYLALSQLANKQKQAPTDRRPIGFTEYDK